MSASVSAGYKGLVLAVHPTTRGFGWVLFESPLAPVDWGIASSKRASNARLAARFERLLKRYDPSVLVLEEFEGGVRVDRIQRLCRSMIHLAACKGMDTPVYRRNAIRTVFASVGASTRYEIAQVIAQHLEAFSHKMPRRRRVWENPDPRQSLFDAAALALTYFAVTGSA
jgi:hypothetical protein